LGELSQEIAMGDIFSILSNSYKNAPTPSSSKTKYVPVDPTLYTGTWNGSYSNGQTFSFFISNAQGFRAQVKYQVGNSTPSFQDVLIKDNSFRVGDTKFALGGKLGQADVGTIVTNKVTGADVLLKGTADLV
jgi:hypothetical protein